MRIRSLARAYMIGLGLLALAGIAAFFPQQGTRLSGVEEAETVVCVLEPSLQFVEALALERGVYNQVLISKDTGPDESRRIVRAQATRTDELFELARERVTALPSGSRAGLSALLEQARSIVAKARFRADKVWQDP